MPAARTKEDAEAQKGRDESLKGQLRHKRRCPSDDARVEVYFATQPIRDASGNVTGYREVTVVRCADCARQLVFGPGDELMGEED